MAARVCFPDTSLKVSQMPGERHVACIELHNSNGPPVSEAPKPDGRLGWPTVTAHLIFSATEFKDLAVEHFWAIKCL